jgi:hypothetical protein
MTDFARLLSDLTETAKTLNKESDSLNDLIAGCEDMLRRLNVGLEVWVDRAPLNSSAWIEEDRNGEEFERGTEDVELGFTQTAATFGDEWQLALRWVRYETIDQRTTLHDVQKTKRLLDCSRNERIEALKHLPELVSNMKNEASEAVRAIEAAKRLLK